MKITDGLFHKVFDEVAANYTDIENEHWIVDIGAAKLSDTPENFDVVVLPNLYGDVLSDVGRADRRQRGPGGSANIGEHIAMFECHPRLGPAARGTNTRQPFGLFLGSILMLVHIGSRTWPSARTTPGSARIADGVHTYDIYKDGVSKEKVGTREFAEAVVKRLGQRPETLKAVSYKRPRARRRFVSSASASGTQQARPESKDLVASTFISTGPRARPTSSARRCKTLGGDGLVVKSISNRGVRSGPADTPRLFARITGAAAHGRRRRLGRRHTRRSRNFSSG
jgi:isocitrate dehydrogenase